MKTKKLKSFTILEILLYLLITTGILYPQSVDKQLIKQYFQESKSICEKDNKKLWAVSLYGPFMLVDPKTRIVYANSSDKENTLKADEGIFTGKLPEKYNVANTSFDWNGMKWTMVMLPLPSNKYERTSLMIHELWHRIQDSIGFPGSNPSNSHLDSRDGRILLQFEWQALKKALLTRDNDRIKSIGDALIFRNYRREIYSKAAKEEALLEMNEGLAEYTGLKSAAESDADLINAVIKRIEESDSRPTFVRSFAYISGPAYCFLLDGLNDKWRSNIKFNDDLGGEIQKAINIMLPKNLKDEAEKRYDLYDGQNLIDKETKKEKDKLDQLSYYKKRFIDDPVLRVPLQKMNVQFNPNNLQPLEPFGTVYPTIRITDNWGILTVTEGALMNSTWSQISVPAPNNFSGSVITGAGYKLELEKGWEIIPAERKGDFKLQKQQ